MSRWHWRRGHMSAFDHGRLVLGRKRRHSIQARDARVSATPESWLPAVGARGHGGDTDFVGTDGQGGGKFANADALSGACRRAWRGNSGTAPFVVLTGGEPMLQVDEALIDALHGHGFEIAIETNGTLPVPRAIDWICV